MGKTYRLGDSTIDGRFRRPTPACSGCPVCDPVEAAAEALADARFDLSDLGDDLAAAEERVAAIRRAMVPARFRVAQAELALRDARYDADDARAEREAVCADCGIALPTTFHWDGCLVFRLTSVLD